MIDQLKTTARAVCAGIAMVISAGTFAADPIVIKLRARSGCVIRRSD